MKIGSLVKVALKVLLAIAITAVAGLLLIRKFDVNEILTVIRRADERELIMAALLVPVVSFCRSFRLALAMQLPLSIGLSAISVVHNFVASIAPMRSGELALPILLYRRLGTNPWRSTGILLVLRIYDFLAIIAILCASVAVLSSSIDFLAHYTHFSLAVLAATLLTAFFLPTIASVIHVRLQRYRQSKWFTRLDGPVSTILEAMAEMRRPWLLFVVSVTTFLVNFLVFHFSAMSVDASAGYLATLFCGSIAVLAFVSPVNGVLNVGPMQGAWAVAAGVVGIAWESAIATAIIMHAIFLLVTACLAGLAFAVLRFRPNAVAPGQFEE